MLGEPLSWSGHPTVMNRTVLGKNTACTIERALGTPGLFVVKHWHKGLLVSKSGALSYDQANRKVKSLQQTGLE